MPNKTETDHSFKWFYDPFGMSHGTGLGPWPNSHSDSLVSAEDGKCSENLECFEEKGAA